MLTNASRVSIWEPSATVRKDPPRVVIATPIALEGEIDAILESPLVAGEKVAGETIQAGFRRIEHELAAVFARMPILDARELHRRLSNPVAGDALAARFARLVQDRRQRLLQFLADAPRRNARLLRSGR